MAKYDCNKVCHRSKKRARQAAYAIKAKGHIGARSWLIPYYCEECKCWHLTSKH